MAGNIAKRANGKWRARYRDEAGNERARHFDRKVDAQQWLDKVTSTVITGTYADPKAGRITFAAFFGEWSGPPGLGTWHRARDVAGGEIRALRGEVDEPRPPVGRRDLDQADERRRARSRHDQDAVRQRQIGVPRRREGPGDRLRSNRRRTPPPRPSRGRSHVDPRSRGGRTAHGRGRPTVPAVHRPLRVRRLAAG